MANHIPRDIQEQAALVGAEVYPAQGEVCTRGFVESGYRWRACGKPAVYNIARLTTKGWRMDDMCVDHLAAIGIQIKESRAGGGNRERPGCHDWRLSARGEKESSK